MHDAGETICQHTGVIVTSVYISTDNPSYRLIIAGLQSVETVHRFIKYPDLGVSMANIGVFNTPVENIT